MSCKRQDSGAGYMTSFSYCADKQDQKCIKNFWEYIQSQQQCVSTVVDGWLLDIDNDCKAQTALASKCEANFESSEALYGIKQVPKPLLLAENTKCTIKVDGTKGIARVAFDGNNYLGVLYPGYQIGDTISVPYGDVKYITIYNGGAKGEMAINAYFSSAMGVASVGALAAATVSLAYF